MSQGQGVHLYISVTGWEVKHLVVSKKTRYLLCVKFALVYVMQSYKELHKIVQVFLFPVHGIYNDVWLGNYLHVVHPSVTVKTNTNVVCVSV